MSVVKLKYCRFCAEKKSDAILLDCTIHFQVYKELKQKLEFLKVDGIIFSSEDSLPKDICFPCNNSLNDAYEFLVKLKRSQILLNTITNPISKSEGSQIVSVTDIKHEGSSQAEEFDSDHLENSNFSDKSDKDTKKVCKLNHEANDIPNVKSEGGITDESWTAYEWSCQYCNKIFVNINMLREHSKGAHNLCCALKCTDCDESFDNFEEFVDHVRGHRKELRCYCAYCNLKLEPENTLKHVAVHKKKEYICKKCSQVFNNEQSLREHTKEYNNSKRDLDYDEINTQTIKKRKKLAIVAQKSWNGYLWTCQLCDTKFSDITKLRTHAKEIHGKCFAIKCIDCDEVMKSYKEFIIHARYHRRYLKRLCHYCDHAFQKTEHRAEHIATHFTESARLCEGCGEILPNNAAYQSHVATYNPPKPKIRLNKLDRPLCLDDVTCEICQKVFKGTFHLREHKVLVHSEGEKKFVCEKCGKPFATKSALATHMSTHEESKPVVCEICNKRFGARDFRQHISTHTGEKPFECELCQRRFRLKKQLVSHRRVHTDEKPFKCQYCEKAFRQKKRLKEHENQHTGARPYSCRDCGMEYASWKSCEKHMRTKHGTKMAQGKLIEPKTGQLGDVRDIEKIKEWAKQILARKKRKHVD